MPITHPELVEKLKSLELNVMVPPDQAVEAGIRFETDRYRNSEGAASLLVVCRIGEDGEYLEIFAPRAYEARNCRFKGALFAALLEVSFRTKSVQAEYDPSDGEIRFACDFPVEDATVTPRQLLRLLRNLLGVIEDFHPVLHHAFETGKVDMSRLPKPSTESPPPPELLGLLEELGGIDELKRIVSERRGQGGSR
jgi:hypothetical protein